MLIFVDENNAHHSALAEFKEKKGVNGEKSLSGTIYTNEEILEGIGRGWRILWNDEQYCLTYVYPIDEGNHLIVEFDAVHEFFFDMAKSVKYEELNGSNTMKAYLDFIFDGIDYVYRLEVDVKAFEKESFGYKNRLDLFKDVIQSTGVEFVVNNKVVRILKQSGTDLSTIVRKGFNLNELKIEKDAGSFITYKKAYGAYFDKDDPSKGRVTTEYLSPLSKEYGVLEGDPIVDERYKVVSNLKERLKNEVENSYSVSVSISMEDLTKAGYKYDQPHAGDYIMAINDDLHFRQRIRIISYETQYDTEGNVVKHDVTCGSENLAKRTSSSESSFRQEIQDGVTNAINTANAALISADGSHQIFWGDEPKDPRPGDTWYKEDGEKTVMLVWNGYEWIDPLDFSGLETAIEENNKLVEQASKDSKDALDKANEVVDEVDKANESLADLTGVVDDVSAIANEAQSNASKAFEDAKKAQEDANTAMGNASAAVADAKKSLETASNAKDKAVKSSVTDYAVSDSGTTPPTSGWSSTRPAPSSAKYTWERTRVTLNDGTVIPIYNTSKDGAKGDPGKDGTGKPGEDGKDAPKITKVITQYYLSTSNSEQKGGSWSTSVPTWSQGKYYWTRVQTTFDNGTTALSSPVLDQGLNQSLVSSMEAKSETESLSTTVSQHATQLASKADKTTVDNINKTVTTQGTKITQNAESIKSKADSKTVDTIKGTVDKHSTSIEQNAKDIKSKASSSSVNALTGRVDTAETEITQNANEIKRRATQTTVDTLTGRVKKAETSISEMPGKITAGVSEAKTYADQKSSTAQSNAEKTAKGYVDKLEYSNKNLWIDGNDFTDLKKYKGTTYTYTENISVPEWETDKATTILTSGGSSTLKVYVQKKGTPSYVTLTLSAYVRNDNSVLPITVRANSLIGSQGTEEIKAGENKRIIFTGTNPNSDGQLQLQFLAPNEVNSLKFTVYGIQLEKGSKATDYQPAPEDARIHTAYANSADGKTDFTREYPRENLLLNSDSPEALHLGSNDSSKYPIEYGVQEGVDWVTGKMLDTEEFYLSAFVRNTFSPDEFGKTYSNELKDYTGELSCSVEVMSKVALDVLLSPNSVGNRTTLKPNEWTRLTYNGAKIRDRPYFPRAVDNPEAPVGTKLYWRNYKLEKGSTATPYLSDPEVDPMNSFMKYTGYSAIDSDDPSVYEWEETKGTAAELNKATLEILPNQIKSEVSTLKTYTDGKVTSINSSITQQADKITKLQTKTNGHDTAINKAQSTADGNKTTIATLRGEYDKTVKALHTVEDTAEKHTRAIADNKDNVSTVTQTVSSLQTTVGKKADKSQITQLQSDINLRVKSANVINQINISKESILISGNKVHITGSTTIDNGVIKTAHIGDGVITSAKIGNAAITTAKIKDASISSAKIISLDANKISANYLAAISSNLGEITAGLIHGKNISMDLNTGTISLKKGDIYSGTSRWDLDKGCFNIQGPTYATELTEKGLAIGFNKEKSVTLIGPDGIKITGKDQSDPTPGTDGGGMTIVHPGQGDKSWTVKLYGAKWIGSTYLYNGSLTVSGDQVSMNADKVFMTGTNETRISGALIQMQVYGAAGVTSLQKASSGSWGQLKSTHIYNNTASGSGNVHVDSSGKITRATSARKYKTDIKPLSLARDTVDKRILHMQPVSWQDKAEIEDHGTSQRYYGYIADDFHDAGLTEVVQYGSDGQVEGLSYDRLGIYTIPILKEHDNHLHTLDHSLSAHEGQIEALKERIRTLEKQIGGQYEN